MKLYVNVEQKNCVACGRCVLIASRFFVRDARGVASVKCVDNQNNGINHINILYSRQLHLAKINCPTRCIIVKDKPFDSIINSKR